MVVAVRGLTKVFKDFWGRPKALAVDNVDFQVRRGEVFGLLGPNGSGIFIKFPPPRLKSIKMQPITHQKNGKSSVFFYL